jgi:hypothetical protein
LKKRSARKSQFEKQLEQWLRIPKPTGSRVDPFRQKGGYQKQKKKKKKGQPHRAEGVLEEPEEPEDPSEP